jgi:sec-independent protein translocase protein TatA
MPNIGPMEIIVILIIGLVVLGPKRLPDAGRALGEGLRGFKSTLSGADSDGDARQDIAAAPSTTGPPAARTESSHAA